MATPPEWSLALNELDAALDAMAVDESPKVPARLAFRVRHAERRFEGIDVLLQRPAPIEFPASFNAGKPAGPEAACATVDEAVQAFQPGKSGR